LKLDDSFHEIMFSIIICALIAAGVIFLSPQRELMPAAASELNLDESVRWSSQGRWDQAGRFAHAAVSALGGAADDLRVQSGRRPSAAHGRAQAGALLGWSAWFKGDQVHAVSLWQEASLNGGNPGSHLGLAEYYSTRSMLRRARSELQYAMNVKIDHHWLRQSTDSRALAELSRLSFEEQRWREAAVLAIRARLAYPGNPQAYLALGRALWKLGLFRAAIVSLEHPLVVQNRDAVLLRSEIHASTRNFPAAFKELDMYFPEKPTSELRSPDAATLVARGRIRLAQKEIGPAQSYFESAIRLNPAEVAAQLELGWLFNQKKEYRDAVRVFADVIAREPVNASALLGLGEAHFEDGELSEADFFLRKLIANPPHGANERRHFLGWAHFWRGRVMESSDRHRDALTQFELALQLNPANAPARVHAAMLHARLRQCDLATAHLQEAIFLEPKHHTFKTKLGSCSY
jgi:tetratricopeptide (TPR) repeat protein